MTEIWALAALWLALALAATLISIWLRVATALSEIVVGTIAQLIIGALVGTAALGALMLRTAALGIAVIHAEGAALGAVLEADLVVKNVVDALDLLLHPLRLVAGLRT